MPTVKLNPTITNPTVRHGTVFIDPFDNSAYMATHCDPSFDALSLRLVSLTSGESLFNDNRIPTEFLNKGTRDISPTAFETVDDAPTNVIRPGDMFLSRSTQNTFMVVRFGDSYAFMDIESGDPMFFAQKSNGELLTVKKTCNKMAWMYMSNVVLVVR